MLALTRRLVALRAAHPALRRGRNAHWIAEGDLLAFDRIADGETIRCLFNLGGATIDLAARGADGTPLVALNGADSAALPPCGTLWLQMEG
jgi:alpha-glucosidase